MMTARSQFQEALDTLKADVDALGSMASAATAGAVASLVGDNPAPARAVVAGDDSIDAWFLALEERAYALIAQQAPVATDLRFLIAALRVMADYEKTGDRAVAVAKIALADWDREPFTLKLLGRMGDLALALIDSARRAWRDQDLDIATGLKRRDDALDACYRQLTEHLIAQQGPGASVLVLHAHAAGRNLERIADHAVMIGDRVASRPAAERPMRYSATSQSLDATNGTAAPFIVRGVEVVPWQIATAAMALLLLLILLWLRRSRRATVRRVVALVTRVGEAGLELEGRGGLERSMGALERVVGSAMATAEDAKQAKDRMQLALATVPEGVVVCDETGEIVYQNPEAEQFMGMSQEVLAQAAVTRLLKEAAEGRAGEETLDLYGPPRRTLTIRATPLETQWRGVGGVAVIEDVSERRRLEAVRRDFVSNISHELKTPVGALGLLAETLAGEEDPEVVSRLAWRIQAEAQRVARIMDDLLDLSRIESEETPTREPVPIHLIVAQAAERVRATAEQRGIRIRIGEPPHNLAVLGDRRQLVSALYNLMENAVKYSDSGSTVEVGGRTDGTWIELRVRDHGIGIPTQDLERIFERFYRVDRARGRDTGGTGLGLAIVRHVANNHGGDISVESTEGVGSTFTFRLPTGPGAMAKAG